MRVLIDGDGCPVVDITIQLCRKQNIPCLILCDTAHELQRTDVETLVLDKGPDSVDFAIANRVSPGDLVITQDYGLASMCLARGAIVLHQDGWVYTEDNIDALLLSRHESRKIRSSGGRLKGPKKRTAAQNTAFASLLEQILQNSLQG